MPHASTEVCRPDFRSQTRTAAGLLSVLSCLTGPGLASAAEPHPLAFTGVRIVTGHGPTIDNGVILITDGRFLDLGPEVSIPSYVETIDAAGCVAYPGFIDALSHLGIPDQVRSEAQRLRLEDERPDARQQPEPRTRAANRRGVRPAWNAEQAYTPEAEALQAHRQAGFTTVLVAPRPGILAGQSLVANLSDAPLRRCILATGIAQHAGFAPGESGDYPRTVLGATAQLRQTLLDADWYRQSRVYAEQHPQRTPRPPIDRDLEALHPVLTGRTPLFFEADFEDDIRRALDLAEEHDLELVITGGTEAWTQVDRLATGGVPVLVSLKFPEEPPAAGEGTTVGMNRHYEPRRLRQERRRLWEEAVANIVSLHEAGIPFALSARDCDDPAELFDNLRLAIEHGLPEDAAVAALTTTPATLFGIENEIGTIAPQRSAHLTILDRPLSEPGAQVRWVVIDGHKFEIEPPDPSAASDQTSTTQPDTASSLPEPTWHCAIEEDRFPKTQTGGNVLVRGGTVITMAGQTLPQASVLIRDGRIAAIGPDVPAPEGFTVIDAIDRYVLPGLIDPHSHIALAATNENIRVISAEVRIRDVLEMWPVSTYRALAGGVTTALVLDGSANAIGGQSQVIKLKYGRPIHERIVDDAPPTIKLALGENPTEVNLREHYGRRFPDTRMGVEATLRRAFAAARHYADQRARHHASLTAGQDGPPFRRDLRLESLAEVLAGRRYVHCHTYRADETLRLLQIAEDYGFRVACLHHALDSYRVAPEIARHGCGVTTFANLWAYKLETYDAIPHNAAVLTRHGICTSLHSDSPDIMRYLPAEAAKCVRWGGLTETEALRLITVNPARQLGIDHRTGSIEVGKDGDLAIFNGHPLNAFSKCVATLIDGEVYFEDHRSTPPLDRPCPPSSRAEPALARSSPRNLYAIVNATVHPISSPPIARGTVVMQDGRITAVGAAVAPPTKAAVIDATGLHVYPGLIDAGSALGITEIAMLPAARDHYETADWLADLRVVGSINPHSAHLPIARSAGITTTLVRPSGKLIAGQSAVLRLDGWTTPEMLVTDPFALHLTVPSLPLHLPPKTRAEQEQEHDKALQQLNETLAAARRYQALRATNATASPEPDLAAEALAPYLQRQRPVVLHAETYKEILDTIDFAEQHNLRWILSGGAEAWKLADQLAAKDIPVILDRVTTLPRGRYEAWDSVYASAAALDAAGVRFCFASGSAAMANNLTMHAGLAVAHGLAPERAEYALTLGAARILEIDDRTGSLETGKQADLIVTTHSPLQNVCRVTHVFIAGRPTDLTTRQTRNRDRFQTRPAPVLPPPATLVGPPSLTEPTE